VYGAHIEPIVIRVVLTECLVQLFASVIYFIIYRVRCVSTMRALYTAYGIYLCSVY
jgi:hypothetical protein